MNIWCVKCDKDTEARLTNGEEVYNHRTDLYELPFWICDTCFNFVGTHHKSDNKLKPLGVIATKELKQIRIKIHNILDPLWKQGERDRKELYSDLSKQLGYTFHTAEIRTIEEANKILKLITTKNICKPSI